MSKPILAIVGRPNVGKSTFFNRLIGERRAIVEDIPGVTRDRIYAETEWNGKEFAVIDTGGIEVRTDDTIRSQMRDQAVMAMDMADVICFMVDGKEGLTAADREVADLLRRTGVQYLDQRSFRTDVVSAHSKLNHFDLLSDILLRVLVPGPCADRHHEYGFRIVIPIERGDRDPGRLRHIAHRHFFNGVFSEDTKSVFKDPLILRRHLDRVFFQVSSHDDPPAA